MLQNIITKYGLLNQLNTYAAYGCHTNHIILERNAPLVQTFPTFSYGSMNSQSDNLGFWVIQSFQLFNWFILIMDLNSQLRMNHLKNWRTHMITLRVYGPRVYFTLYTTSIRQDCRQLCWWNKGENNMMIDNFLHVSYAAHNMKTTYKMYPKTS